MIRLMTSSTAVIRGHPARSIPVTRRIFADYLAMSGWQAIRVRGMPATLQRKQACFSLRTKALRQQTPLGFGNRPMVQMGPG
jgi:hypothetical protein